MSYRGEAAPSRRLLRPAVVLFQFPESDTCQNLEPHGRVLTCGDAARVDDGQKGGAGRAE